MSRLSIVNEAVSKLMELETIQNAPAFGKTNYGIARAQVILKELSDLRYTNALCGETEINNWLLKLNRKFASIFSNL